MQWKQYAKVVGLLPFCLFSMYVNAETEDSDANSIIIDGNTPLSDSFYDTPYDDHIVIEGD
ncbi:hypothetical protein N9R79_11770, partial [Vibrio sp.]|nr:hypothetical protein [Vibrio sp.]